MDRNTKIINMTNDLYRMWEASLKGANTTPRQEDEMRLKFHKQAIKIYNTCAGMGKELRINILLQYNAAAGNLTLSREHRAIYRNGTDELILFMDQSEISEAIQKQKEQLAWINKEPTYEL